MSERTLAEVVADVRLGGPSGGPVELIGSPSVPCRSMTVDSREVGPGTVFACVSGGRFDGHDFAPAAVEAGAVALVVERRLPLDVPQIVVGDVRATVGPLAASLYGHPSDDLLVVGITGTNGKTTTSHLLAAILDHAGIPTAVFGTLSGRFTTPEAPEVQARLAEARAAGRRAVVMEVSSHALALHRVDGTRFAVAVFTNLGRDHYDFHGTEERYFAAKARLFTPALSAAGVVNLDDVHGRLLADVAAIPTVGYTLAETEGLEADAATHRYRWQGHDVVVPLGGRFNAENSLAAATAAHALGLPVEQIVAGLAAVGPVPGRFERIDAGQPFSVVVDYAHTPDGLRLAIAAAREAAGDHRVIVVFGCGGDRDQDKRPQMGAVAAAADVVVVTSDNPRSEDPRAIMASILSGVPEEYRSRAMSEPDRRVAIAAALHAAGPGDVVLVAGKGHETTQTTGTTVVPFDDRAVVRTLLENPT